VRGAPCEPHPGSGAGAPGPRLGSPRVHLRLTASTNDRARELALEGAPHGTLVTAHEQSAGRGRQGRRWSAPAGSSLLMSLLVRSPPPLLPLIAAVTVCDLAGDGAMIKWPNDIVVASSPASSPEGEGEGEDDGPRAAGERGLAKLAGILIEGRPQEDWAVLGIGLNVAVDLEELPGELRSSAATLGLDPADVEPTLARLLASLMRRLGEPAAETLACWRARDALHGREVAWAAGRGRAEGIDGTGRLIVSLSGGGRTALGAGEVHLLETG
jgi:BirA family transcriptional regulator, biotin operon repressor / biotin---[acetyl-CoA-carboxylase] ligase